MSACLLGVRCRYDGASKASPELVRLADSVCMIPVCPEQLGGLPTPRPPAVILGGDGRDVLSGRASVRDRRDRDVTGAFVKGAREAVRLARALRVSGAVLKDRSPSCGLRTPYCDRPGGGVGVAAALLEAEEVRAVELDPSGALPATVEELATGSEPDGQIPGDRSGTGV